MQRLLVILSLVVALQSRASCCLAQELELECSPSHYKYDWERLNYYELLGLKYPASELDSKGIRKAYRQQAQLWHPDKNQNSNSTSTSTSTSTEECTARFSRIADAYGVLNNADKRYEYDLFLQYCDEQGYNDNNDSTTRSSYRQKWSKLFAKKIVDPLRVFEEFLFGGGYDRDESSNSYYNKHDQFRDSSFGSSSRRHQRQQHQHQDPIRISKHQDTLQDPYTGEEIIRISQTEEYPPDPSSGRCCYYRILSQEFTKRFDPYTGLSLHPITEPYVRDEGYSSDPPPNAQSSSSSSSSSPQPRQSLLFPGDILTPKSALLVSPNQRYYAGLSPECELIIMVDNTFGGDDDLIWSSETFGQNCFATIKGPHLVVAMGRPELPHRILWYSNAQEDDDDDDYGLFQEAPDQSTYLAQLDNDGSLVVYKVWSNPDTASSLSVATKVWMATRQFLLGNTRADAFGHGLTYKRCIYATGPLGCVRVARRLYQVSLDIYYTLKRVVSRIDAVFDTWMDLILEEDDYLHAFQESIWNGFGSQMANKSARLVRKVVEFVMLTTRGK
jgi:curved DNA-binding protein CbpA